MAQTVRYIGLPSGDVLTFSITSHDKYLDVDYYEIEDVMKAIENSVFSPHTRIFVLDSDETVRYQIPNEDIQTGGSYSENYQDGQRRSLSFSLYNEYGKYTPSIDNFWAGTKLRLEQGIELSNGDIMWFYKGIYVINQISFSKNPDRTIVQVSAKDKFSLFEGKMGVLDSTYEIPIGTDIQSVIKDILLVDVKNGVPLDPKPIIYHQSFKGKTTQATITKTAGETYGSILLELATQLSAEIFYNSMGNLVLIPTTDTIQDSNKTLIYNYDTVDGGVISLDTSFDVDEITNRIIVLGSSSNGAVHKAVAENKDARSPLCVQRIGVRTASVINDNNITTDLLAQERAEYELRKQLILKSSVSGSVIYNPLLNINNLVAISDDSLHLVHERFLLQSVSCNLDFTGTMSLSLSNLKNLFV